MSDQAAPTRILPPHCVRHDFLPLEMVARLLAYAAENRARFKPSGLGHGASRFVDPARRISSRLRKFSPVKEEFAALVRPLALEIVAELKIKPFTITEVELEFVAHNDGAFYSRHIDTRRGGGAMRLLSSVYYFHAQPKAFEGGALRLHEIARDPADAQFLDIGPAHNSMVFFPSWMPHEVMPVRCPSGRFEDSRFAINCWFRGMAS